MADLTELAAELRRRAQSARDVGDSYDEGGQPDMAARLWGSAEAYADAAMLLERKAEVAVKWCGICDTAGHTSDEHPKPPKVRL